MNVVIGVDPHKASHTAVSIDEAEDEISGVKVRATRRQVEQLVHWVEPFEKRRWTIESAGGMGYLLAQQLVARGEEVLDVPATLASRVLVLGTGRSNKNDPNDAHSIAVAAFRTPNLRSVEVADHSQVLRLLAKRNIDLGSHRTRVVCRLHALLAELAPGGIAKELYASDAERFLAKITPQSPAEQVRCDMALELLDDVRRLDEQTKESHRRIRIAIKPSGTSLTEIYGVGPINAAQPIGYAGDVRRFANAMLSPPITERHRSNSPRAHRVVHRVSQRGNRRLNHALHMVAVTQIRNPATMGRV
jgi:transposase